MTLYLPSGAFSSLLFIAINVVAQTSRLRHTWAQTNSLCYRPDYFIDVFDDDEGERIRILVISRQFDIYEYKRSEREDRVWEDIVQALSEAELECISRIVAINPEEIKIYT